MKGGGVLGRQVDQAVAFPYAILKEMFKLQSRLTEGIAISMGWTGTGGE